MAKLSTLLALCLITGPLSLLAQTTDLPYRQVPLADLAAFQSTTPNWRIVGGVLADRTRPQMMKPMPGKGVLANLPGDGDNGHLFTGFEHGDMELDVDVLMPAESNSGLYFQGRYEVQLFDSWGKSSVDYSDLGGIYERWDDDRAEGEQGYEGHAPSRNTSRAPGLWQHLNVMFQAPRFDENGAKVENAVFKWVRLNGVTIQENVEVTGPTRSAAYTDEGSSGPLMIQGDHGPVAFRNLRYRLFDGHRIELLDVTHAYYEGDFVENPVLADLTLTRDGPVDGLSVALAETPKRYVLAFEGLMSVPETGAYRFDLYAAGEGSLSIGDETLIDPDTRSVGDPGRTPVRSATSSLTAGSHPFRLTYAKGAWNDDYPALGLFASGPGMVEQQLTDDESFSQSNYDQYIVDVGDEPVVFRGFIEFEDTKRTHAAAVGDPTGLHYSLDMQHAALLSVWKGEFVDATSMWHMRGEPQIASPLGTVLPMPGVPSFALLGSPDAEWPDSLSDLTFKGYTLGPARRPTFEYAVGDLTIQDHLAPDADGQVLTRTVHVDGAASNLWILTARTDSIEDLGNGRYRVGQGYYIEVPEDGWDRVVLRSSGAGNELLIQAPGDGAGSTVTYDIVW